MTYGEHSGGNSNISFFVNYIKVNIYNSNIVLTLYIYIYIYPIRNNNEIDIELTSI